MGSNSSSSNSGQAAILLDSQAAVTALLSSIRASELTSAQKNELRDLVFLYTNGGHDDGVRSALEQKIKTYGIEIQDIKKKSASRKTADKPRPTIGNVRTAPSFSVSKKDVSDSVASEPTPAQPEAQKQDATVATQPEKKTEPKPVVEPVPEKPKPEDTPETVQASKTPSEAQAVPVTTTAPSNSAEKSLERIREIKASVNEKVGNPVNLVEQNPEVGREYMSALLEAMKKVNSGASANTAMERLEAAYSAVAALDSTAAATTAPSSEPQPAATPTPAPVPQSQPATTSAPTPTPAPQLQPAPTPTPQPTPASQPAVQEEILPAKQPPVSQEPKAPQPKPDPKQVPLADMNQVVTNLTPQTPASQQKPQPAPAPAPIPAPTPKPVADTPAYVQPKASGFDQVSTVPIQSSTRSSFATDSHDEETASTPSPAPITPLSAIKNPLPAPKPESKASAATDQSTEPSDPLYTSNIDNGLQQLLEEWPIFQKSGLFGTGPKGREHPLFKKVAGLQIPLLLAGRFEGATQEIKQSITDYMNGWRYEQGIIYEQGETFEHYLRRVIKHILDLQKGRM